MLDQACAVDRCELRSLSRRLCLHSSELRSHSGELAFAQRADLVIVDPASPVLRPIYTLRNYDRRDYEGQALAPLPFDLAHG